MSRGPGSLGHGRAGQPGWPAPDGARWPVDLGDGGIAGAFSSRLGGCSTGPFASLNLGFGVGDEPRAVEENARRFAAAAGFPSGGVATVGQVHGVAVLPVTGPGAAGTADGLCTDVPGVVLAIGVADCAALFLADPVRRAVALCHAGWRGTAGGIGPAAVEQLALRFGSRPADIRACVSPCIGACCYEVDMPVIEAFGERAAVWLPARPGHARLDIAQSNRLQLERAGVPAARIAVAGLCTACHPEWLFSHRRDHGRTGRMRAALWLR